MSKLRRRHVLAVMTLTAAVLVGATASASADPGDVVRGLTHQAGLAVAKAGGSATGLATSATTDAVRTSDKTISGGTGAVGTGVAGTAGSAAGTADGVALAGAELVANAGDVLTGTPPSN